jgi:PhoH-like ATPase
MNSGQLRQFRGGSLKFTLKKEPVSVEENNQDIGSKKSKKSRSYYKQEKSNVVTPRNEEQYCAFDLLNNDDITCKLLTGNYGSGKTMLATYAALQMLNSGKVDKIIWLRNNISAAGTEQIGYLPGTEFEKLKPWLGPFIDHLGSEQRVMKLVENGQLEVPALGFIRGRNLEHAVIICSEAQNLTEELVKLIIGRVGEGSYLIFDGDFHHQVDRPLFEKSPGIKRMIEVLAGNPLFGYVHLPKSERSSTARLADEFEK